MTQAAQSDFEQPSRPAPAPQAVAVKPSLSRLDSLIFYGLFGLLLFGPLAFGAVEPAGMFVLQAGAAALFVLWVIRQIQLGEINLSGNPVFAPMAAFGCLITIQLLLGLTAYRYVTASHALLYATYGMLSFLVVQNLRRTSQLRWLAIVFSGYGAALALFALVQGLSGTTKLYWMVTPRLGGWIYGPYVNHNHYAGLMEMLVPIPLVVGVVGRRKGALKALALSSAVLMASTIFLSGSRGGMAAFLVQLLLLAIVMVRRERHARPMIAIAVFLACVAGLLIWLGGGELAKRLTSIHTEVRWEASGGTRLAIDRDALTMFPRKPVLGWGLGTFPEVYPQFRSFYTNFFVNAAHNDYLQLLVEMGALGFIVMLWMVFVVYRAALRKLTNWPSDTNAQVAMAALLGVTGILVHSTVDFNLHIPANAALFYVLCAVAASEPGFGHFQRRTREKVPEPNLEPRKKNFLRRFLDGDQDRERWR